jgi:hypothetical protein
MRKLLLAALGVLLGLPLLALLWLIAEARIPPLFQHCVAGVDVSSKVMLELKNQHIIDDEEHIEILFAADYPHVAENVKLLTDRRVVVFNAENKKSPLASVRYEEIKTYSVRYPQDVVDCESLRCLTERGASIAINNDILLLLPSEENAQPFIRQFALHVPAFKQSGSP